MKKLTRILALTLCCLLAAGCTLGPDYKRPDLDLPAASVFRSAEPLRPSNTPRERAVSGRFPKSNENKKAG